MRFSMTVLAAFMVLMSGCANRDVRLTAEDRSHVSSIRLVVEEGNVTYSGKLPLQYENDSGNGLLANPYTMPLGLAYEIYRYPKTLDRKAATMRAIFDECEVSVPDLVATRFLQSVEERPPVVAFIAEDYASARLTLTVSYGISGLSLMHDAYIPWLEVVGELVASDGERVLWRKTVTVDPDEPPMRELPFPDPFEKPKYLERLYSKAARKSCEELVQDLMRE